PYSVNQIYIFPDMNSLTYWIGQLSPRSREFQDCTLWEVKEKRKIQKTNLVPHELEATKRLRELEEFISNKLNVKNAHPTQKRPSQRISEIRENKGREKTAERKKKIPQQISTDTNIISMPTPKNRNITIETEAVHYPDLTDELFGEDE
ncbi:transposase, partial [Acinetobacter baumannii]|nr:transposase [Acinetobacter baumannii]